MSNHSIANLSADARLTTFLECFNAIASPNFQRNMSIVLSFMDRKESTPEERATCFFENNHCLSTHATTELNSAQREIVMCFHKIRCLREMDVFTDDIVRRLVNPHTIRGFIKYVLPLSLSRQDRSLNNTTPSEFWEKYIPQNNTV